MLLIQSDMLKAIWFMVFPVVDSLRGPIKSSSAFCQVSGFFLAVGIEASDVAVLLIAIHTALYVSRPKQANGQNGLYPYRHWAYAAYLTFPVFMASLAFVNRPTGYVNVGEFCYLPRRPSWPSIVLSWIPRCIILLTILAIYAYVYSYVSHRMKRFDRGEPAAGQPTKSSELQAATPSDPSTPPPVYQGSAASSRRQSYDHHRDRQNSVSTLTSLDYELGRSGYFETLPLKSDNGDRSQAPPSWGWKWPTFLGADPAPPFGRRHDPSSSTSNLCPTTPASRHGQAPQEGGISLVSRGGEEAALLLPFFPSFPARSLESPGSPQPGDASPRTGEATTRRPSYSSTIYSAAAPARDPPTMARTRHRIRYKTRLLFIYPLVYIVIWILPFIAHVKSWAGGSDEMPFGILASALASLCIQGAVNCLLFSVWEKPWRHVRAAGSRTMAGKGAMVGRTREEMMVDGRIARARLGAEIEERRRADGGGEGRERQGEVRHWWDQLDVEERGNDETLLR